MKTHLKYLEYVVSSGVHHGCARSLSTLYNERWYFDRNRPSLTPSS